MSRKHKSVEPVHACHVYSKHIATENLLVSHTLKSPRLDCMEAKTRQSIQALLVDLENLKIRVHALETKTQYQDSNSNRLVVTGAPITIR